MLDVPSWIHKDLSDEKVIVTGRDFDAVSKSFLFPEGYFDNAKVIVSLGEGRSNFAGGLGCRIDAQVIGMDPIYKLGRKVLSDDTNEASNAVQKSFGGHVKVSNFYSHVDEGPTKNESFANRVAGDVHQIPLLNESIDRILGNRVYEHIDFSEALPELLRILKPGGEIRLSEAFHSIEPDKLRLLTRFYERRVTEGYLNHSIFHIEETMRLLQNDPAISMYFVIDRPLGKGLEKLNFWTSSVMVIRKDDKYPTFSIDDDSVNLGSVFKAIGKRKVQDPHYYYNYYKLKQVG